MKQIIELIAARQKELGYSNRKMAISADINPKYYSEIIHDKRPGVSYGIIEELAAFVGLELLAVYNPSIMRGNEEKKETKPEHPVTPSH